MSARRRLRRDPAALIAIAVLVLVALTTLLAPLLAPFDPAAQPDIVGMRSQPPSLAHWFGTDPFSRDVLSRVLYGGRVSLAVGALAMLVAATVGTAWGAIAGYAGGWTDLLMMRVTDAMLSVPRVLLLLAILSLWGGVPVPALVLLLGLTGWFGMSRLVRAEVRAAREREYVAAANALGAHPARVLLRHALPSAISPVLVAATLGVGHAILLEAGLSFLGVGVRPPQASWGSVIRDGADAVAAHWWVSFFPGLMIALTVTALNVLGDSLRDALETRQLDGS